MSTFNEGPTLEEKAGDEPSALVTVLYLINRLEPIEHTILVQAQNSIQRDDELAKAILDLREVAAMQQDRIEALEAYIKYQQESRRDY